MIFQALVGLPLGDINKLLVVNYLNEFNKLQICCEKA